jgi:pimeloyl-ACP methyl ester carboxylesterase
LKSYDYDTLADDLNEVITQLNLEKVVLVGFSMAAEKLPVT